MSAERSTRRPGGRAASDESSRSRAASDPDSSRERSVRPEPTGGDGTAEPDASQPDASSVAGRTVAVVLAAGRGSRFSGDAHKLEAEIDGEAVGAIAIRAAIDAGVGPVVVVTGAIEPPLPHGIDAVRWVDAATPPHLVATPGRPAVHLVHNPRWADGQSTSLRTGIDAAAALGADAVVVGLADQPFVGVDAWRRVAAADAPLAAATYAGRPRNPVRLGRSVWHELPTSGDVGARDVLRDRRRSVAAVPCDGSPADIDTLEDLRAWQNRSSTNSP